MKYSAFPVYCALTVVSLGEMTIFLTNIKTEWMRLVAILVCSFLATIFLNLAIRDETNS